MKLIRMIAQWFRKRDLRNQELDDHGLMVAIVDVDCTPRKRRGETHAQMLARINVRTPDVRLYQGTMS